MRKLNNILVFLALLPAGRSLQAQVLNVIQIKDAEAQRLQTREMAKLQDLARIVQPHQFPYDFYFTGVLDVPEKDMRRVDQNSIRFDRFDNELVLAITGNYYAAYAADRLDRNDRIHDVLKQVVTPLLRAAVSEFDKEDGFTAFAFEISYHVREKAVTGMEEHAENAVFVFPRAAARHFVTATTEGQFQAAILDSKVFVNSEPFNLWIGEHRPSDEDFAKMRAERHRTEAAVAQKTQPVTLTPDSSVAENLIHPEQMPVRIIVPQTLTQLSEKYSTKIEAMQRELGEQANFVSYASPGFIVFHQDVYLQLPLKTKLDGNVPASRYKLAALSFDDHISHLIRPTLAYFESSTDFDGIVFSTSIAQPGKDSSISVEYFIPLHVMRCYAQYDCTGQQMLDGSFLLINGERESLNLEVAEGDGPTH